MAEETKETTGQNQTRPAAAPAARPTGPKPPQGPSRAPEGDDRPDTGETRRMKASDPYEGIPTPPDDNIHDDYYSRTIPGGATWVNRKLVDANGEPLSPEKIQQFREHHAAMTASRSSQD